MKDICTKCGDVFNNTPNKIAYRNHRCNKCLNEYDRLRRLDPKICELKREAARKSYRNETLLQRFQRIESEKRKKLKTKNNLIDRQKRLARCTLNNAVRSGKIIKEKCACGSLKTEAHHSDYSKPLSVLWACRSCHSKLHYG